MKLKDKILCELYEKDNFTTEYTDIAAVSLYYVYRGIRADDYINMKSKMTADKEKSRLVFTRLFHNRLHYKVNKYM